MLLHLLEEPGLESARPVAVQRCNLISFREFGVICWESVAQWKPAELLFTQLPPPVVMSIAQVLSGRELAPGALEPGCS